MRVWLILILTLSFALPGWATAPSSSAPCPMQAEMAMAMADTTTDPAADSTMTGDCCNDMATALRTGQTCKTGQDCQTPLTAMLLPQPEKVTRVVVHQTAPVWQSLTAPSATVAAVWRPPTAH